MKNASSAIAFGLLAIICSTAHAATNTSSTVEADIFGANPRLDAFDTSTYLNGVSVDTDGQTFAPKGVTTGLSGGIFSDVVTDSGAGHDWTVISFGQSITAFGGLWNTYYKNFPGNSGQDGSLPGAGLRISIGDDDSYEFEGFLPTTLQGTFVGFKSDVAFDKIRISYMNVPPQQETYQISDLQFTAAVPEPETYAMLLAGLGVLSFTARRRKPA